MRISIVVPLHNEEENLGPLLNDLLSLSKILGTKKHDVEIVLINDHSSDSTKKICEGYAGKYDFIRLINRQNGVKGMGASLIEGTKKSSGEIILWVMGDRSDDLNAVPRMIEKINLGYDIVFGSRYTKGGSRGDLSFLKAFLSSGYSFLCKLLFCMPVNDITNAYRCFRRGVFNSIKLESKDFAISPEFAIKTKLKGYRLGEVPVTYSNRKIGKTNFNYIKMGIRYLSLFKYIFKGI